MWDAGGRRGGPLKDGNMGDGRSRRKSTGKNAARLVGVAWTLAVLAIVAIVAVRYSQTPKGNAFLLESGFEDRYDRVQEDMGGRIVDAISSLGVKRDEIVVDMELSSEKRYLVCNIRADLPEDGSLIQANAAIDKSIAVVGGVVHSCREKQEGRVIEMEVGTKQHITHRCYLRRGTFKEKPEKKKKAGPVIAIVVDDFGYFNNDLVKEFLALDVPLTISVIPELKHSAKICALAKEAGKEILCHMPMEPESGGADGGEIPLVRVDMEKSEMEKTMARALETTPHVVGMNNHMGSKATADRRVMGIVLDVCRKRNLLFFDSLTTPKSVVREVADEAGVANARNDIFLDNKAEDTRENMKKLLSIAEKRGRVIGVMHVRSESLQELKWLVREAGKRGMRFSGISGMAGGQAAAANQGGKT